MLNFPQIEEKILKFWQEKNIFKKTLDNDLGFDFGRIAYSFMNIWWRRLRYMIPLEDLIFHWIELLIAGYTMTAPHQIDKHLEGKMVAAGDWIRGGLQKQLQNYFRFAPTSLYTTIIKYYTKKPFIIYRRILFSHFTKRR